MAYLLFPGRHLLHTKFQQEYLWNTLRLLIDKLDLVGAGKFAPNEKIDSIIFAVTSANQENSRYNPIPFHFRSIGIDRFARQYKEATGISYRIIGVPHYNPTDKFADFLIKEIYEETEGELKLGPENTIVLNSTKALIDMFVSLGFSVLPAEFDLEKDEYFIDNPVEVLKKSVDGGGLKWLGSPESKEVLSDSTISLWEDFNIIPKKIVRLWKDPLLTDDGSITDARSYSTYAIGLGHNDIINIKYNDIKEVVREGKIVDEGAADCALLVKLSEDFPDSDLIGIEVTTELTSRCLERLRAKEFGGAFVHIHQRNIMEPVFEDNTIDTTLCNSTTHELWSYGEREKSVRSYLEMKYKQLRKNGRIIIRDVVGPENKDMTVYMRLDDKDGSNEDALKKDLSKEQLTEHLNGLSTRAKFFRFSEEYLEEMRQKGKRGSETKIKYTTETIDGQNFFVLTLKDAVEFMTKKDYTNDWRSELNEEFAFWSFGEWKDELSVIGFSIIENPNQKETSSRVYTNPWIVENRWEGKVDLFFKSEKGQLTQLDYPVTTMVLVGEKI